MPLAQYCVTWRRIGERDSFDHMVIASDIGEARCASRAVIRSAIGPNISQWELESVARLRSAEEYEDMLAPSGAD
jgi:hypothetical protein